jgi:5-methylcytosine-specific restriction enzyme A
MPPGWTATRRRVLIRDPICRMCAKAPSTEVHHPEPGVADETLLMGVCAPCRLQVTKAQGGCGALAWTLTPQAASGRTAHARQHAHAASAARRPLSARMQASVSTDKITLTVTARSA